MNTLPICWPLSRPAHTDVGQFKMAINIYEDNEEHTKIAWLCDNEWELPDQIHALEEWLKDNQGKLKKGNYIADLGFSARKGATGGGPVISTDMMQLMINLGIDLYLSEYDIN